MNCFIKRTMLIRGPFLFKKRENQMLCRKLIINFEYNTVVVIFAS